MALSMDPLLKQSMLYATVYGCGNHCTENEFPNSVTIIGKKSRLGKSSELVFNNHLKCEHCLPMPHDLFKFDYGHGKPNN